MYIIYLLCNISILLNQLVLRKTTLYLFFLLNFFLVQIGISQTTPLILRCASVKLIDWFKENYWLPQSNHVQSLRIESTNNTILPEIGIKRDIEEKNKLSDYACLRLPKKWKITHPDELYPIGFKQTNR